MAMEAKIETTWSDYAHATGASEAGPAHILPRKYSNDTGNRNNNRGGSHNHIGKGSKINNNVVDILDLAVPQSKVRPIDRLLDRYDWSSASMTPLLHDTDRPQRAQYDHPLSRPGRPEPSPPRRPPPPPPPPTRPPLGSWASEFSDHKQPVRKTLWKRARELVSSFFVRAAATVGPNVDCFWSH
ncbi:uncharacterized protein LOC132941198 [Metopolophium dirhodum]|uniref:uncharacterized protein LOC132941198 n=1 Tax=Metopolophium dirhodum TaxID=44670 RepID=UPI00298F6A92|nr:uncharacterized protein LOC132941198 [Metopolophium dirhodum]